MLFVYKHSRTITLYEPTRNGAHESLCNLYIKIHQLNVINYTLPLLFSQNRRGYNWAPERVSLVYTQLLREKAHIRNHTGGVAGGRDRKREALTRVLGMCVFLEDYILK